jgi:hypothetical protein
MHGDRFKDYHKSVVPLLHRMLNLEQLDLYLIIEGYKRFVDGNDLERNIFISSVIIKEIYIQYSIKYGFFE